MSTVGRLLESAATAALAGVFGAFVGAPVALSAVTGGVAAANGAISGWRGIYDWTCSRGMVALTLDSTWALPMTAAGLFANGVGLVRRESGYVPELSTRQNRHVYRRGFMPRKGFAITLGNVISGAGDVDRARRARLVTDHEDVHIWQGRFFGPAYPCVYAGWTVAGAAVGAVLWLARVRREPFTKVVESSAYYLNPFEWWAYSRDANWPPRGKIADFGWRRPCCRPLSFARPAADPVR